MTREQQKKHFQQLTTKLDGIMEKKGDDYANKDRLSNFKLAGDIAGIGAELNCLSLIATKVARLGVLMAPNAVPNNESVRDSIEDLVNYGILLHMLEVENFNSQTPTPIVYAPQPQQ